MRTLVSAPGLYTMPLADYLADPCPEPSLNHSLAHILLSQSAWHARLAHPKLAPGSLPRGNRTAFDLGAAVHQLVLEGEVAFLEVAAKDWKTKGAQADRRAAWETGLIPLLSAQLAQVRAMAAAIRAQCDTFPAPIPLATGDPERVLVWREDAIWCRARLDWLHWGHATLDDLKTTGESAHPEAWARGLFDRGQDLQVAFHTRGVQQVLGGTPEFRFVVVETAPPHALSVVGLNTEALEFADVRRRRAVDRWARCLRTGHFPGYPRRALETTVPPWVLTRAEEAVFYEAAIEEEESR